MPISLSWMGPSLRASFMHFGIHAVLLTPGQIALWYVLRDSAWTTRRRRKILNERSALDGCLFGNQSRAAKTCGMHCRAGPLPVCRQLAKQTHVTRASWSADCFEADLARARSVADRSQIGSTEAWLA